MQVKRLVNKGSVPFYPCPFIPEKNLPKVFERFYHADHRSEADAIASSGLGLSIVQSIVKIHNGNIRVTSQVRQGTTFYISFPV